MACVTVDGGKQGRQGRQGREAGKGDRDHVRRKGRVRMEYWNEGVRVRKRWRGRRVGKGKEEKG